MKLLLTTSLVVWLSASPVSAQVLLTPKADVHLSFSVDAEGHRFKPTWGLDQAWMNEQNLRKGVNHIGKENIGIGRTAFRFTMPLLNDSVLQSDQINALKERNRVFDILDKTLPLVFTADQEAGTDEYFVKNKSADVDHWSACINSHVHWIQANSKHPVIGVSPFNEPDYWTVEEGATIEKSLQVANILKNRYPRFADIPIVGGNTLNNDKAWEWFEPGKDVYEWGNTHQLAGSFDTYAQFHQRLAALGRTGYNDEMHNVGEAMIGLEYGMTVGIWWGFDSRARGEFCDISSNGQRLAYAEHRPNWTAASVYRHDDGRVKAFLGTSERQAYTTTYCFVSTDRPVYFDGFGPQYAYAMEMPGGTGYAKGQANAERVIDITWGDDVQPCTISEGVYKIVNKATGNVLAVHDGLVKQQKFTGSNLQLWTVKPCSSRVGGDFSFYDISSVSNPNLRINVKNFSTLDNVDLLAWEQASPSSNEMWYLQYAGNGYYYLRNRESSLYMASYSDGKYDNVVVKQRKLNTSSSMHPRFLWRILPDTIDYDTKAPVKPQNLTCTPQSASVRLTWDNVADTDLWGYMVIRAEAGTDDWNTIARLVPTNTYIDNDVCTGTSYIYKVKAVDHAQNISQASDEVSCKIPDAFALVGRWTMEDNFDDTTENAQNALFSHATTYFVDDCKEGQKALRFMGALSHYMQLPYSVASNTEFTFSAWVNLRSATAWQRIFDFGYDTSHYLFLTPTNGSVMRFAINNGDGEQMVDAPALTLSKWQHVAVTLGKGVATIYVDGKQVGRSEGITIMPAQVRPVLNYIGRSQFPADPYFTGFLDDVRIYNRALTAEQVAEAMTGDVNGIRDVPNLSPTQSNAVYDLGGRPITNRSAKGLLLENKKKVIK